MLVTASSLVRAMVDDFTLRYAHRRSGHRKRYVPVLSLLMYDLPPVKQVGDLMGVRVKLRYRRAKSGVLVPCWAAETNGYGAYRIQLIAHPFLVGQKAFQAEIALAAGPITDVATSMDKALYKERLLSSIPMRVG